MPYRARNRTRSNAKRTLVRAATRRGLSIVQVGETIKPPYTIPSMATIRATPKHGHTVVSLFAGCGGSCLGFEWAGFRVCYANEFVPEAQDVYRRNHPDVHLDGRDIRTVTADEILQRAGIAPGEVDVLQGSPPCASFSMSGNRTKFWGKEKSYSGTSQRTDDLFFEYVRLLEGLQPKVFVAENVAGLVRGQAKGMFKEILTALGGAGYHVEARILDAQWLGVPQIRARLIFQGIRRDIAKAPAWPTPLPYQYSVRDALPHVCALRGGQGMPFTGKNATYDPNHPSATILAHANLFVATVDNRLDPFASGPEPGADMSRYAIGEEWKLLREGEVSRRYQNLIRAKADAPAPTITAAGGEPSAAAPAHPYECRKFSIAELRRLCGFPDDFVLTGTYTQQWERLGRAVPPPMMRAVARGIATEIFDASVDAG